MQMSYWYPVQGTGQLIVLLQAVFNVFIQLTLTIDEELRSRWKYNWRVVRMSVYTACVGLLHAVKHRDVRH